jgi:RNA-binding protein PNO1
MAHKSHRQKALQAQLEAPQEISVVKPKAPKVSKVESGMDIDDDAVDINQSGGAQASTSSSGFAPLSAAEQSSVIKGEFRRVPIPPHRMTPLKREWVNLYTPMVEMLGLQVRMNVKRRAVEIKVIEDLPVVLLTCRAPDTLSTRELFRRVPTSSRLSLSGLTSTYVS